ncbi:MAG: hypothetical protein AAFQ98_26100, partial [Bacteroidota bacterium]
DYEGYTPYSAFLKIVSQLGAKGKKTLEALHWIETYQQRGNPDKEWKWVKHLLPGLRQLDSKPKKK